VIIVDEKVYAGVKPDDVARILGEYGFVAKKVTFRETPMAKKILIIDDDSDHAGKMTPLLEKAGYQLQVAVSGNDGIKQARNGNRTS